MCTAVTYRAGDSYFGRTLDLDCSYAEEVTITPRHYPLVFRSVPSRGEHYAMIGMAHVADDYPLYYDGANEKGLAMAGLNFPGNAHYCGLTPRKENVASFELIPWVLGQCATAAEAAALLARTNIVDTRFNRELPASPLHWLVADGKLAFTVEPMKDGLHVRENPVGILTNNPPFDRQLSGLNRYRNLTAEEPENRFLPNIPLESYSRGLGAVGLPGDWSSESRFVRASFVKENAVAGSSEQECVSQFFHILDSVAQPLGCCRLGNGRYERTIYSSCCNTDQGIYYYTTYGNRQITAVHLFRERLDGRFLVRYPLVTGEQIRWEN